MMPSMPFRMGSSGFDDGKWWKALVTSGPGGELVSQEQPPIRTVDVLHPLSIAGQDREIPG